MRIHPSQRTMSRLSEVRKKVTRALVVTEIVRWICMAVPTILSVWIYARKSDYTIFISGWDVRLQFWVIVCTIFLAGSLFIYLPLKLVNIRYWFDTRQLYGWRPSILMYITLCALPCFTIVLVGVRNERPQPPVLDSTTETVLQVCVFGLTLTEWMAKIREEVLTYDLISAMAIDFFFAYDVIETLMMPAHKAEIFESGWLYVCFAASFVSMFKYLPVQPISITDQGNTRQLVVCILVSMFCNDIPFVIIRVTTMVKFGLAASDIIHPLKNVALIGFNCTQLYIVWTNSRRNQKRPVIKEKRISRREHRPDGDADVSMEMIRSGGRRNRAFENDKKGAAETIVEDIESK